MQRLVSSELFALIREFGGFSFKRMLYIATLVGLCNTSLIIMVNQAANQVANQELPTLIFLLFVPLLLCFLFLMRLNNIENITGTQMIVHRFRMHVMGQILKTDLLTLDRIGRTQVLSTLNRDALTISQATVVLVPSLQALSMFVFAIAYLFFLSVPAAVATCLFGLLTVLYFASSMRERHQALDDAWIEEGMISGTISEFLTGFKEIKMNSARAMEMSTELVNSSRHVTKVKTHALIGLTNNYSSIQILIYVLVGVMIFVVPILADTFYLQVIPVTTTVLFVVGSVAGLIQAMPLLSQAKVSAQEIQKFLGRLEVIRQNGDQDYRDQPISDMKSIRLENICYRFRAETADHDFELGPISYEFKRGVVYFVRGNNGSGKTSLMRLLTGLISPDSGRILVDDREVLAGRSQSYRDLFSCIFGDFHLFRRLYGIPSVTDEEIQFWLNKLEIADKISVVNGKFDNLNLSTGQRKRVALLVALLEKRPVIILDEWASDQDPAFRKFFYGKIVPELKAMNKIVIAITHDENYFDQADHLLVVEHGRLREDHARKN